MQGRMHITIKASFQLATIAITNPAVTVARFWTISASESPTSPFMAAASAESLAPIAPLKKKLFYNTEKRKYQKKKELFHFEICT